VLHIRNLGQCVRAVVFGGALDVLVSHSVEFGRHEDSFPDFDDFLVDPEFWLFDDKLLLHDFVGWRLAVGFKIRLELRRGCIVSI
jgi:hypothetical protein